MEAALWTFDCIIELTWARGLERKTSSNRERASSTPSFDDDADKKSLSMNDLFHWKVLPTEIGSREGWTKRFILYISFDLVRFMTKTNENRRKSHYWTRENSRENSSVIVIYVSPWYVYPHTHIPSDVYPSNMAASEMCIPYPRLL